MSQVVGDCQAATAAMFEFFAPIREEMGRVEQLLKQELRNEHPFVDELVKHGFRIGGKRLRPALVLLSGKAAGKISQDHIVLGAVVEMIHTATLVHDDVLDEAEIRRHIDTVNARWNNESSVLLGDYLFTHSFYLASTLESTYACRTIGRSTNRVCEGELLQGHHSGNLHLGEADYLEIIDAKTAELTACCCRLGAHYAGVDAKTEESLTQFGRDLGIAFQIADDLLDVLGDEAVAGKSLGTDLEKRKATLPLIRAMELASIEQREKISALLVSGDDHREALRHWLEEFDAIEYTRQKAKVFAERALSRLEDFPDNASTEVLRGLTEFVISRQA